jgi:hypothetical protein
MKTTGARKGILHIIMDLLARKQATLEQATLKPQEMIKYW